MSYLLAISIGPVQDFIAAARRTADLYAGSQILQEISKAIAGYLHQQGAKLIFPSDANADGANKILVEVEADPRDLAEGCKKAAQEKLLKIWDDGISRLPQAQRVQINEGRAKEQLETFLEFYAAWVPLGNDYPDARKAADRLLAGRKALREFAPTDQRDEGVPKSPLDPSRAAVIEPGEWGEAQIRPEDGSYKPLRIKSTETLDTISLLKRAYGVRRSGTVVDTRTMARRAWNPEARPEERYDEDDDHIQEPQPYFAILTADGDKMGDLISQKESVEEHQKLSSTLDEFARKAKEIVTKYHGFLVYSGGDDVMAMLPVNTAINCALELSEEFRYTVRGTLSAGVAVVHYREPFSTSLEAARSAERVAKDGGRDSLAVALHTRGGAPLTVVRQWDKLRWQELQQAFTQKQVTQGLAYELQRLAEEWHIEMPLQYLKPEAERILKRKEVGKLTLPDFSSAAELKEYANQLIIARFLSGITSQTKEEAHA